MYGFSKRMRQICKKASVMIVKFWVDFATLSFTATTQTKLTILDTFIIFFVHCLVGSGKQIIDIA